MRFLQFVSCYGPRTASDDADGQLCMEETGAPVPLTCATGGSSLTKRSRRNGTATWRPSLVAISEDGVVGPAVKVERTVRSTEKVLGGKGGSRAKVYDRGYRERLGHSSVPVVIPAFTPTAFLF